MLTGATSFAMDRPEALEGIAIQDSYMPSSFKEVGKIERIVGEGRVVVLHRAKQEAYFASLDDPLHENDAVYTLGRMRCRLLMKDRNVITMAPGSDLNIDEVTLDDTKGEKRSLFEVTRGKAVFYAIRLFRFREVRLKLKTPTATVGIRGTKFGTEVIEMPVRGERSARTMAAANGPVPLGANSPDSKLTRVFVSKGSVNVTSAADGSTRDLGENEFLEVDALGLGRTFFDPGRVQSFVDSVEGPMVSGAGRAPGENGDAQRSIRDKQQQDDMIRQLEQVEDAKQHQIQDEFEHEPESPSRHTPPSGGGCTTPCP
jgi:hypothetical protein